MEKTIARISIQSIIPLLSDEELDTLRSLPEYRHAGTDWKLSQLNAVIERLTYWLRGETDTETASQYFKIRALLKDVRANAAWTLDIVPS